MKVIEKSRVLALVCVLLLPSGPGFRGEGSEFVDYGLEKSLLRQNAKESLIRWYREAAFRFKKSDLAEMKRDDLAWKAYKLLDVQLEIFHNRTNREVDIYRKLSLQEIRKRTKSAADITGKWPQRRYAELHKSLQLLLASKRHEDAQVRPYVRYIVEKIEFDAFDAKGFLKRESREFLGAMRAKNREKAWGHLQNSLSVVPINESVKFHNNVTQLRFLLKKGATWRRLGLRA